MSLEKSISIYLSIYRSRPVWPRVLSVGARDNQPAERAPAVCLSDIAEGLESTAKELFSQYKDGTEQEHLLFRVEPKIASHARTNILLLRYLHCLTGIDVNYNSERLDVEKTCSTLNGIRILEVTSQVESSRRRLIKSKLDKDVKLWP